MSSDALRSPQSAPRPNPPTIYSDVDHRIVGTILGPAGKPLHTVKKTGSVPLGFQPPVVATDPAPVPEGPEAA